jgi:Rrf2 family protein
MAEIDGICMKLLTKESDYAIRSLLLLAGTQEETVSSKSIAESEKIPLQFLRRILQTLTKAGIITAREGINGGVSLARSPQSISLSMIITLFQGDIQLTECLFRKKLCHNRANCVLRHRLMAIERKVADQFNTISIGTLLEDLQKHET